MFLLSSNILINSPYVNIGGYFNCYDKSTPDLVVLEAEKIHQYNCPIIPKFKQQNHSHIHTTISIDIMELNLPIISFLHVCFCAIRIQPVARFGATILFQIAIAILILAIFLIGLAIFKLVQSK